MSRFFVVISGLVFLCYGLGFVIAPALLSQAVVDAVPAAGAAMTDVRATYGGMSVAVGGLLLLLSRTQVRLGLLAVLLLMVFMAVGRAYGLAVDEGSNRLMLIYLVLEAAAAVLSVVLLWRDRTAAQAS